MEHLGDCMAWKREQLTQAAWSKQRIESRPDATARKCSTHVKAPLRMRQVFVEHLEGMQGAELEREMFILRKLIEKEKTERIAALGGDPADFYICTMSNRTIVYKVTHRLCNVLACAHRLLHACCWMKLKHGRVIQHTTMLRAAPVGLSRQPVFNLPSTLLLQQPFVLPSQG